MFAVLQNAARTAVAFVACTLAYMAIWTAQAVSSRIERRRRNP